MCSICKYIDFKWKMFWATTPEEKYPAKDEHQKEYRHLFGDIVDQYLIYCDVKENGDKSIVYIDAENDIDWQCEYQEMSEEETRMFHQSIAKLDVAHSLPVQNLSKSEVINFKKILGVGYSAALHNNWNEVDMAIEKAEKYRTDRNKERSRLMLLGAATLYLFLLVGGFVWFYHCNKTHPHLDLFWGIIMGAVGAYVSIWMRYGKMDMTGLGTRRLHYLEAFARMLIGAIFATIIIFAFKSGFFMNKYVEDISARIIYSFIGFCAGFSEKFVPSVMESFMNKSNNNE